MSYPPVCSKCLSIVNQSWGDGSRTFPRQTLPGASLRAELALTRQRGYGTSIEESEPGTCAIGVAIIDPQARRAIGTVSVAGPVSRLTRERIADIAPDVQATATEIADLWPSRKVMEATMGLNSLKAANN